ncbi:retron system putative HNH endonuclease [Burkholderia cepacia]|uniref:retron system putative HNH endonuclease n=1 Tax=Burkholderia cepacia TaxID=292 RepID=UPI001588B651|nr:retron system putative HNH endonuclease [Burkholderia cepacia]
MKYVAKGASPAAFEAWKDQANDDWQPTYSDLQNPEKRALHTALLDEQGWVCCYCGRSVTLEDSHIEHFRPQHSYGALQLRYDNLHASCVRAAEPTPDRPLICGHAKGREFNEDLHIAPIDPGCEARYIYSQDGAIRPTDLGDAQAIEMARVLALDLPILRAGRSEVLKVFDSAFLETASVDELTQLRDAFRRQDDTGRLPAFGHVVARYAEQCLADMPPAVDAVPNAPVPMRGVQ